MRMTQPTPSAGPAPAAVLPSGPPGAPASPAASAAIVLANLGTPAAPTAAAVRAYLSEFLSDRRVVDLPRVLWWPLLNGVILPLRAPRVARKYAAVWMAEGSPLAVLTRRLAQAVQACVATPDAAPAPGAAAAAPAVRVVHAMRYGAPSLREVLEQLRSAGVRRIAVIPLYPQFSTTTTASVQDVVAQAARDWAAAGDAPQLHTVEQYAEDAAWVAAIAESIRRHRAEHGNPAHTLFSFHGLPQRLADAGDPYPVQCLASARAVATQLGLADEAWSLTYQSRFGREKWLEPATADTLTALAQRGVRCVDVVAPGFAVDCLETLEEVAKELAADFAQRGGTLRYIPCLNDDPGHARALARIGLHALDAAS